jgi:FeS assembly SUF system regulator
MIKVSKLADYAVVILSYMDGQQPSLMCAGDLSTKSGLPEPTVSKILKLLVRGQVLNSVRGANGGYVLARDFTAITVAEVIYAIDGPIALTSCVEDSAGCCDYSQICPVNGRWNSVNEAIKSSLADITLAHMMNEKQCGKKAL